MVVYLSKVAGALVLALGVAALGAVASSDAYSVGARTEANSYKVINRMMGSPSSLLCLNTDSQSQAEQQ